MHQDVLQIIQGVVLTLPIFMFSLVFHEFSHAAMANRLGALGSLWGRDRLTLDPRAHLDPIGSIVMPLLGIVMGGLVFGWARPVPFSPISAATHRRDMMLVALAGPVSNLLLLVLFSLLGRALLLAPIPLIGDILLQMVATGVMINALLAVFNMIPLPPLDGSKVVAFFLPPEVAGRLLTLDPMMSMGAVVLLVWFTPVLRYPMGLLMQGGRLLMGL